MASYEYSLPVKQWRQVLVNNSPGDLCKVMLVSRHMNNVASLPELWAGMKVNGRKVKENGLAEFYNINRFKKVKEINFNIFETFKCEELERLLKEIPGSPLESVNLLGQDLSGMSAELLASAVSHLHIVNLRKTDLTTDQCLELLNASLSSTTLKNLNLFYVDLSKVPAELLANSISKLYEVNLRGTALTTDQCAALLKASLSSATLKNVNLEEADLSEVPAELLANSISRLQGVSLGGAHLTSDQCVALLKASLSSATLKNVDLQYVDLSEVPAELLANSISKLYEVYLRKTALTTDQCVALLKAILSSATLKNVNLMYVDLSKVPAELLAKSISRLQEVNLATYPGGTHLTSDQCAALLKASLSSATLKNVNLEGVDLSEVPAELLANSISRLQKFHLSGTDLTTDQCIALLKACHSSSTLQLIDLLGCIEKLPSDKKYLLTTLRARMFVMV